MLASTFGHHGLVNEGFKQGKEIAEMLKLMTVARRTRYFNWTGVLVKMRTGSVYGCP